MSNVFICILINWLLRRYLILWVEILCMYTCHSRPVGERSLGWESDRDVISGKSFPAFSVSTCFRNWKRENPTVALIILICAEKVKVNLNIISIIYVSPPNKESESNSGGDMLLEDVVVMVEVERGGGGGIGTSNWSRADRRVNPCIHPPLHYLQLELSLSLLYNIVQNLKQTIIYKTYLPTFTYTANSTIE